jgi:uncharacterized protein (DUF1778 family)
MPTNNKAVSEFLLDSSLSAVFDMLADRRAFQLDEVQWAAFIAALDTPPRDNLRLRELLRTRAAWDSNNRDQKDKAGIERLGS